MDNLKKMDKIPYVQEKQKYSMDDMVEIYIDNINNSYKEENENLELEIRFSNKDNKTTKINYDNIVKYLFNSDFKTDNINGYNMLRVIYEDKNIRAELNGIDMIQNYCKTNSINKIINKPSYLTDSSPKITFTKKINYNLNGQIIYPLNNEKYYFRTSLQNEKSIPLSNKLIEDIIINEHEIKKTFRLLNRVQFYHDKLPIKADLSIVKTSITKNGKYIPFYTIYESKVFDNIETYEIELEVDNNIVKNNNITKENLLIYLKQTIKLILCGLQDSNFPISYDEIFEVSKDYMKSIYKNVDNNFKQLNIKNFIAPSSLTLQFENLIEYNNIPCILKNYSVTEKADGERKLLYIDSNNRLYLINNNLNIQFTGVYLISDKHDIKNTIIDGEHVKLNKNNEYINLYLAFDIYILKSIDVRHYDLLNINENTDKQNKHDKYRLNLLNKCIELINNTSYSIIDNNKQDFFRIKCKKFYSSIPSIFNSCNIILSGINDDNYEYDVDGLIFTPINTGVGGSNNDSKNIKVGPLTKYTWQYSLKWKPPKFNTIDFLINIEKDKIDNKTDKINIIYKDGIDLTNPINIIKYKTLFLRCGFDKKKYKYADPFKMLLDDIDIDNNNIDKDTDNYVPELFKPTEPYDINAHIANIILSTTEKGENLLTENNELIEDNTIVEFYYDFSKEPLWRWTPLRVRYDKTTELRNGIKNYGNSYDTANSNWKSIHNPITEDILKTGLNIPSAYKIEDIYYNRLNDVNRNDYLTQSLKDFHNLYVKNKLINIVSNPNDILIDYSVGKAGDIPKWINSKLLFVFGIDISKDNIYNKLDGACVRYLNNKNKNKRIFKALFLTGNSSLNIRNGDAFYNQSDKLLSNSVFGIGDRDKNILGNLMYNNFGIAKNGFNISSCQFSLHYFFENIETLKSFIINLNQCTSLNGYFIGTCYDGNIVFNKLKDKKKGEYFTIYKNNIKIFEIKKMYDNIEFNDDETSLGYPIDVYQESINKVFTEYLVNFNYFKIIMQNYGFVLLNKEQEKTLSKSKMIKDTFKSTGTFRELFTHLDNEIKNNSNLFYGKSLSMSNEEKQISFLNRYFIFKKIRNVNIDSVIINQESKYDDNNIINKQILIDKFKLNATNEKYTIDDSNFEPII